MSMDQLAEAALGRFGLSPRATATLCNVSENHTYRVEDPTRRTGYALRVHRPGYRTPRQIESELQWVDALRADDAVDTPTAVPARRRARGSTSTVHNVVLWEWLPGSEPDPEGDAVLDGFRVLGAVSARMHAHARAWQPPAGFDRPPWDYDHTLGAPGTGAAGRTGSGWGRRSSSCSGRLDATIAARLAAYGQGPSATASSTPTSASPTCSSTTATCA
jgi:Ser/Thr protein kinase RdoA (MazF antagonist)